MQLAINLHAECVAIIAKANNTAQADAIADALTTATQGGVDAELLLVRHSFAAAALALGGVQQAQSALASYAELLDYYNAADTADDYFL